MTYKLREITAADQQKILQDMEKNDKYLFYFYRERINYNPSYTIAKTWAVDDQENSYLFRAVLGGGGLNVY